MNKTQMQHEIFDKWIHLCGKIINMYYENYKGAELPRSYLEILMYLTRDENICEPSVIADSLCIPRQTMTSIIDSMVKQKLVKRIPHLSDRRRIQIEITEKGRKTAVEFKNRLVERFHQLMDSSKQKAVLEKISAALTLIEEVEFKA